MAGAVPAPGLVTPQCWVYTELPRICQKWETSVFREERTGCPMGLWVGKWLGHICVGPPGCPGAEYLLGHPFPGAVLSGQMFLALSVTS